MEASIPHWDIAVRDVASESMARIAVLDLDYACNEIIPKLVCATFLPISSILPSPNLHDCYRDTF